MKIHFSSIRRAYLQALQCVCLGLCFVWSAAPFSVAASEGDKNTLEGMDAVVAWLREEHHLVSYEPVWSVLGTPGGSLSIENTNTPAAILQRAIREFTGYRWQQDGNRYRVFPARAALSEAVLPSMTTSNRSLLATLRDPVFIKHLKRSGLLLNIQRNQSQQWRDIHLSLDFGGGSFADFLDNLSGELGDSVCWSIEYTDAEPVRVLVGDKGVTRQSFTLHFHPLTGERLRSTRQILKVADMDRLRDMLEGETPGPSSEVAFELALRYWRTGDVQEATNMLQRAEDLALSDEHRWQLRYRVLNAGLGYPSARNASEPMLAQHEAFINQCSYAPIRHQALWWMLREYIRLGQEEMARNLIESENETQEWQYDAARYYQRQFPNTRSLDLPQKIRDTPPHKTVVHTTVTIEKAPDGKLQVHRQSTNTAVPLAVGDESPAP